MNIYYYFSVPSEVIQTTDAHINKNDIGHSCQVVCTIMMSEDTETKVTWLLENNAEVSLNTGKYSTMIEKTKTSDIFKYVLVVHSVQLSDVGRYSCRVDSQFDVEDEKTVQIIYKSQGRSIITVLVLLIANLKYCTGLRVRF